MRKVVAEENPSAGYSDSTSYHAPKVVWVAANIICISALLLQALSIYTPNWRIAEPITYSFMHLGTRRQHVVGETRYGLHAIHYDNDAIIQPWHTRVDNVKTKGYTAIQYNEQVGKGTYRSVDASYCSNSCRDAILLRMEAYEQIMNANNVLATLLIIGCALAVMGIAWYLFFDESVMVTGGFWATAAVIVALSTLYWNHQTYQLWKSICSVQQIPFPFAGPNFRYTLIVAGLFVIATLLVATARMFGRWCYNRHLQKSLETHLRNKQGDFDPYSDVMGQDFFKQVPPTTPIAAAQPPSGLNPSQLFSGIGFGQDQNASYQYPSDAAVPGPSMWNTNLKY